MSAESLGQERKVENKEGTPDWYLCLPVSYLIRNLRNRTGTRKYACRTRQRHRTAGSGCLE